MTDAATPTPSQEIVASAQASRTFELTDLDGRKLLCRTLGTLDNYRLMKSLGQNSANMGAVHYATVAHMVIGIDGVPVPTPNNDRDIEAALRRLGDIGFNTVMMELSRREKESMAALNEAIDELAARAAAEQAKDLVKN